MYNFKIFYILWFSHFQFDLWDGWRWQSRTCVRAGAVWPSTTASDSCPTAGETSGTQLESGERSVWRFTPFHSERSIQLELVEFNIWQPYSSPTLSPSAWLSTLSHRAKGCCWCFRIACWTWSTQTITACSTRSPSAASACGASAETTTGRWAPVSKMIGKASLLPDQNIPVMSHVWWLQKWDANMTQTAGTVNSDRPCMRSRALHKHQPHYCSQQTLPQIHSNLYNYIQRYFHSRWRICGPSSHLII